MRLSDHKERCTFVRSSGACYFKGLLTPGAATKKASPLAALFGGWAPLTSVPWSLVIRSLVIDYDYVVPNFPQSSRRHIAIPSAPSASEPSPALTGGTSLLVRPEA